jgi:hypothetical protein
VHSARVDRFGADREPSGVFGDLMPRRRGQKTLVVCVGVRSARRDRQLALEQKPQYAARGEAALREFCQESSIKCDELVRDDGELVDGDTFEFVWGSPADRRVAFLVEVSPLPGHVNVRPLSGSMVLMQAQPAAR